MSNSNIELTLKFIPGQGRSCDKKAKELQGGVASSALVIDWLIFFYWILT